MKKTSMARIQTTAAIALMAIVAGCSDGELWSGGAGGPGFNLTPTPLIIRFSADPAQVQPGESTTISWEVADADSVSITAVASDGSPVGFSVETSELSGSAPVASLSSTTDFILTASKTYAVPAEGEGEVKADDLAPEPSGPSSVSQTITVTVISPTAIEASITADKAEAMAGESTVIRWTVSPAEGVAVDVAADSDEPIIATDQCEGDLQSILDAATENPLDPKPAVGCAVVAPVGTTAYTVTATDANDPANVVTASATIEVSEAVLDIASFTANGQENAAVLNFNDPIELQWLVTPAGALVTIEASPAAGCELPVDKPSTGELELLSCTVAANTTFTLTARMGEASAAPRVVTVSQQVSGSADLKITAAGWAFPNEEVDIKIEPAVAGSAAAITKITIDDAKESSGRIELPGFAGQAQIIRNVRVPLLGVRVRWECTGCAAPRDAKAIEALPVQPKVFQNAGKVLPIVRVAPMPAADGVFLYGTSAGYNGGTALVFKSGITLADELMLSVGFGDIILGLDNLGSHMTETFLNKMDYPVGAIAVAADGRIYAGVSGALLSSDDGGTWDLVDPFFAYARRTHAYPGQHPSCAGETQKGNATGDSNEWTIASFHQFCDALTFGEKGLMVATDRGVFTLNDVDVYVADRTKKETAWKGIPAEGQSFSSGDQFLTFSRVANDLEEADGKVYAATSKGSGTATGGVFVSSDRGDTWQAFGLADTDVYSLTYDKQSQKLYAGTEGGVKVSGTDSASWADVGTLGQAVYSLAVDPYSAGGVVMAGTSEGISIIRNAAGGGVWAAVSAGGADGVGKVRALTISSKVDDAAGKVSHYLSIGTAKGVIAGAVQVNVTGVVNTAPPAKQPPAEEPPAEDQPADDESPEDQPQP